MDEAPPFSSPHLQALDRITVRSTRAPGLRVGNQIGRALSGRRAVLDLAHELSRMVVVLPGGTQILVSSHLRTGKEIER